MSTREDRSDRFVSKVGESRIIKAGSPLGLAMDARTAAGLPLRGVSDEELVKWWAEQQNKKSGKE